MSAKMSPRDEDVSPSSSFSPRVLQMGSARQANSLSSDTSGYYSSHTRYIFFYLFSDLRLIEQAHQITLNLNNPHRLVTQDPLLERNQVNLQISLKLIKV